GRAAGVASGAGRGGSLSPSPDLLGHAPLLAQERIAPLRGSEHVEEGHAGEPLVAQPWQGRGLDPPALELPPAGGRDPVERPPGPLAGTEDPEDYEARPPQTRELGVDLGELGSPDRLDLLAKSPREGVSGPTTLLL